MMQPLRLLLIVDAAVLFLLGFLLILAPQQVARVFHFQNLSEGVHYLIGLWGCGLVTMAIGYLSAAQDPIRHAVWVQVGIARGALECLLSLVYLARGVVTFSQAGFGIIVAALFAIAYAVLYPREEPLPADAAPSATA